MTSRRVVLALAISAVGLGFTLAGCASPAVIAAPTPVSCVPKELGPAPTYTVKWSELATLTPGERYAKGIGGFKERDQRLAEVEPVIEQCRKAGSPPVSK